MNDLKIFITKVFYRTKSQWDKKSKIIVHNINIGIKMTTDPSFQMPILNLEEVYKIYQSEKTETAALRGVSLDIKKS